MNDTPFSKKPSAPTEETSAASAANDLRSAAENFAKTTGDQGANVKDRAVETANALRSSASEKVDQYKAVATEKAEHYRTVATEKAQQVKETAQKQWGDTQVKAKELHVTSEDYIKQNPSKAVLGALGIGFLIGLIARR